MSGLFGSLRPWNAAAIGGCALALLLNSISVVPAQQQQDRPSSVADARTTNQPPLSNLADILAERYPTVRSLVLARGSCSRFEYYGSGVNSATLSPVHSVTKSVLSILVGIATDDGYLRLDEKLSEIVPDAFGANIDPRAAEITVRDLLTKTEGFAETGKGDLKLKTAGSEIWPWMLKRPVKYQPGTHFRYDGIGSDLLSVVLSKAIRRDSESFARQRLFGPLQIENYKWSVDIEGYLHGESGLWLTARDMAKIGLLYLRHGQWQGKQIVSEAFVQDSISKHNDGGPPTRAAYGYQWWVSKTSTDLDAFFAAGRGSQLIYVVPKLDLVAAVAANSIQGGSQKFINDVVLPVAAELGAAPCIVNLEQVRHG